MTKAKQRSLVKVAKFRSSIFLTILGFTKSIDTVEQAVKVMLDRVDTEAEMSSTRITPINKFGKPAESSIKGTIKSLPPSGIVSPKKDGTKSQ